MFRRESGAPERARQALTRNRGTKEAGEGNEKTGWALNASTERARNSVGKRELGRRLMGG